MELKFSGRNSYLPTYQLSWDESCVSSATNTNHKSTRYLGKAVVLKLPTPFII